MKAAALLVLVLLSVAASAQTPASPDLRRLLQEGLFEEEANRNLDAASTAYEGVIQAFDNDRQFAATALFRLGEVRAKQKRTDEAIALFQRVLTEFANNDALARLSRERLTTLGGKAPAIANADAVGAEEAEEIARLQELARNSPDLLRSSAGSNPPLRRAAERGWLNAAVFLLEKGVDINEPRSSAPLSVAAAEGRKAMVELLIKRGADVNVTGAAKSTPLQLAVEYSRLEVARVLLESGANPNVLPNSSAGSGRSPLHAACMKGDMTMVRLLLEKGADVNLLFVETRRTGQAVDTDLSGTPLLVAVYKGDAELVRLLLEHRADPNTEVGERAAAWGPVRMAVRSGDIKLLELLIEGGANAKLPGLIASAAESANTEMIRMLARHGADLDSKNAAGNTALHISVRRSLQETRLLLELGASPNVPGIEETTPLHLVLQAGDFAGVESSPTTSSPPPSGGTSRIRPADPRGAGGSGNEASPNAAEVLKLLIEYKADLNLRTTYGHNALHVALQREEVPLTVVEWLFKQGADANARDLQGATPAQVASLERRLWFEQRTLFVPWTKLAAVSAIIRSKVISTDEPYRIEALSEFDTPGPLHELLRKMAAGLIKRAAGFPANCSVIVLRSADGIAREIGNFHTEELSKAPRAQWGDVIVFFDSTSPVSVNSRPNFKPAISEIRRINIKLGDRHATLQIRDSVDKWWAPMIDPLPGWGFSDLIAHVVDAEPRAKISEIKVQRMVDDKLIEWPVDLRPDHPDTSLKPLDARLADGDTVVIPLLPFDDAKSLDSRRKGIFWSAPGRVFGQRLFRLTEKDNAPRTLAELIAEAYGNSTMIVPNPDLARIQIHRMKADGSGEETITVDLAKVISTVRSDTPPDEIRRADVPLQWGDVVEISPRKDSDGANWTGFTGVNELFLKLALSRDVAVESRGFETQIIALAPRMRPFMRRPEGWVAAEQKGSLFGGLKVVAVKTEKNVARINLHSRGTVREFTPEEFEAINPWLLDRDKLEIDRL